MSEIINWCTGLHKYGTAVTRQLSLCQSDVKPCKLLHTRAVGLFSDSGIIVSVNDTVLLCRPTALCRNPEKFFRWLPIIFGKLPVLAPVSIIV